MSTAPIQRGETRGETYSYGERFLRLCNYQAGIYSNYPGTFEKVVHAAYLMISEWTLSPTTGFDAHRAEKSLETLKLLGGKVASITSRDQRARIQIISFKAQDFKAKLEQLGAQWRRIRLGKTQIFAIIPPTTKTSEWSAFETAMISRFKWAKITFHNKTVIKTGDDAALIREDSPTKLFIHSNSASTVSCMLGGRVGLWLGCQQDAIIYDPRGTWKSSGIPTEAGYYHDAEAVLTHALEKGTYALEDVWITARCGGVCANAYLQRKFPKINMLAENAYVNLNEDLFDQQSALPRFVAYHFYRGLQSKKREKVPETGFRIEGLWKGFEKGKVGKIVIVYTTNDQRLKIPDTPNKMRALAQKVGSCVAVVRFTSPTNNPHRDYFYRYPKTRTTVLSHIFNT